MNFDRIIKYRYYMNRRRFNSLGSLVIAGIFWPSRILYAETYLTVEQARQVLWNGMSMHAVDILLTRQQMQSIRKAGKVRVRNKRINAWKTDSGGWFIVDNVIGKHENIDIAVALGKHGEVKGIEVLVYRETYGDEVRNVKWLAQFHGRDYRQHLKLDRDIKNISGATLSCRHITDGINRLTHTWNQVLRHL